MFLEPMSLRSRVLLIAAASAFVACSGSETTSPPDAPGFGTATLAKASSRTGVADSTQVRTNSTTFVSDNEVVANITISSTATVGSWDVMIVSGTKTGVG